MAQVTGPIEKIDVIPTKTKMGMGKVYHVYVNGTKYNNGFKFINFPAGTVVSFEAEEGQYGWQCKTHPVASEGGTSSPSGVSAGAGIARTNNYGNKGVFPIPPLDGQRAIVRQNALTNARELYTAGMLSDVKNEPLTKEAVTTIINIAREFEAYACGDIETRQARKELEEAAKSPTKKSATPKMDIPSVED